MKINPKHKIRNPKQIRNHKFQIQNILFGTLEFRI